MRRVQLKTLLAACPPPIVFDGRARALDAAEGGGGLQPFFEHTVLKNAMLIKSVARSAQTAGGLAVQTRLYFPFDPKQPGNGGMSLLCDADFGLAVLEKASGMKLEGERIAQDLKKIPVLARLPSFSPFLLRDAFERAGVDADRRHFRLSDADAAAMRDALKAKLKPLAAMALALPSNSLGDGRLDLLARKLWELDDPGFLVPFGQALKIQEGQTIEVLYAWIGVSHFQREFAKRQSRMRQLAEWLAPKSSTGEGLREEQGRQIEADRAQLRESLRLAWTQAGAIVERYGSSYDALINKSDAKPFVAYLESVRDDFQALGARLALIEQCLCVFDVVADLPRGSQLAVELLQDLAASTRDGVDNRELVAA